MKKTSQLVVRLDPKDSQRLSELAVAFDGLVSEASIARFAILRLLDYAEQHGNDISHFLRGIKRTGLNDSDAVMLLREDSEHPYRAKSKSKKS